MSEKCRKLTGCLNIQNEFLGALSYMLSLKVQTFLTDLYHDLLGYTL